jgi:hypothetical protein
MTPRHIREKPPGRILNATKGRRSRIRPAHYPHVDIEEKFLNRARTRVYVIEERVTRK